MVAVVMGYEDRPRRARVMLITEYPVHWRSKGKDETLSRSLPLSIRLLLPCRFSATAHASWSSGPHCVPLIFLLLPLIFLTNKPQAPHSSCSH